MAESKRTPVSAKASGGAEERPRLWKRPWPRLRSSLGRALSCAWGRIPP